MSLDKLVQLIKKEQDKQINDHPPAKKAYIPTEQESSDLDRFKLLYDEWWVGSGETRLVESDGFHPSHLGVAYGNCMRRAIYLLRGVEKKQTFDARIKRVFQNGHDVHGRIQYALSQLDGCRFDSEVTVVYDDPPVRGHADGVLELWNQRKVLIEIKSCNDNVFDSRKKWKCAKEEHIDQAAIYAYILGIDTIWVIYECKNSQEYAVFESKLDTKRVEKQLATWRGAYKAFEDGQLAVRPYKMDSKNCSYCDMKEMCWSDSEIGVKIGKIQADN